MNHNTNEEFESPSEKVFLERTFTRFSSGQRWEHAALILSFTTLFFTGIVQKYRTTGWSHTILSTPERLETIQFIHHTAAVLLTIEVIYHIGRAIFLLIQRRLPGSMLPRWQDLRDAFQMLKYLFFLSPRKPEYGKYNFEQKFTYWFLFFAIGIMVISGFIIWFPMTFTRFLPGGIIPAAKLAHSTEAVIAGIFILIWHFYHVHVERLNLSIFTGRLSEKEMLTYHSAEYKQLTGIGSEEHPGFEEEDQ